MVMMTDDLQVCVRQKPFCVVPYHAILYTAWTIPSQDVRPSIRLSVRLTHAGIVSKRLNITSNVIHRLVTSFLTPNVVAQRSNGDRPNGHVECKVL